MTKVGVCSMFKGFTEVKDLEVLGVFVGWRKMMSQVVARDSLYTQPVIPVVRPSWSTGNFATLPRQAPSTRTKIYVIGLMFKEGKLTLRT